jgi:ClpX C4-type zinc finger
MNETTFINRCSFCGKQQDQVERLFFAPPVERAAVAPITTVLTAARSWSRKLLPMGKSLRLVEGGFPAEKKHYQVTNTLVDRGGTSVKRMNPLVTVEAISLLKTSSAGGSLSSSAEAKSRDGGNVSCFPTLPPFPRNGLLSSFMALNSATFAILSDISSDILPPPFPPFPMRSQPLLLMWYLIVYTGFLWGPFGPVLRGWARNASKESSKSSQSWPNFIPSNSF